MKLKQINPALFKLFIPYDELEDRGVNCQVLTSHSVETHSFFYHIIQEVLEECGNLVTGYFQMDVYSYPCYGIYMILKRDAYYLNEGLRRRRRRRNRRVSIRQYNEARSNHI